MTILGLGDVTENCTNDKMDFNKARAAGCKFGIVRATTTGAWSGGKPGLKQDLSYENNVKGMDAAGLDKYTYVWFDPRCGKPGALPGAGYVTPKEQAEFYIAAVLRMGGPGVRAVVDVENSINIAMYNANSLAGLKECVNRIADKGWNPAIYTFPDFVNSTLVKLGDISWLGWFDLLIAHWGVAAPSIPYPWYPGQQIGWQYTNYAPGAPYGFAEMQKGKGIPRACMAVLYQSA